MKRIQTFWLFAILLCSIASAQTQLENAGFELWEDILVSDPDTIREPVDWSSLKTSDNPSLSTLAPVVCFRSNESHSGNYSLQLMNIQSFIVANGVATNGRLHPSIISADSYIFTDTIDGQWNTPFTGRPDSLAGWFNYSPQGGDNFQIQVTLHQGFGKRPDPDDTENWVAEAEYTSPLDTEGGWARFSTPIHYFNETNPEYVLIVLNSGNGFEPVVGSVLLVDDLEMIYNSPQSNPDRLKQTKGYIYVVENRQLILKGLDPSQFQNIDIYDISGKLLWAGKLTADQFNIAPANLGTGLYLFKLSGRDIIFTQKVLLR
ncbi:MAG: PCMD domain-containing protein [Bacteroidales bacterium]